MSKKLRVWNLVVFYQFQSQKILAPFEPFLSHSALWHLMGQVEYWGVGNNTESVFGKSMKYSEFTLDY